MRSIPTAPRPRCRTCDVVGIDCHIGSQLLDDAPLLEALDKLIELIDTLADEGIVIHHLDMGGGIGINYGEAGEAEPVPVGEYLGRVFAHIDAWRARKYGGKPIKVAFEPGRSIVGDTGVLLTSVEFLKPGAEKNFCIVDAAMNDLMRPALYQAWMDVQPVAPHAGDKVTYDVVGPVCESGDWLARDRELAVNPGDLLAIMQAGAYGLHHVVQLQHPWPRGRGDGRWRQGASDPPARKSGGFVCVGVGD